MGTVIPPHASLSQIGISAVPLFLFAGRHPEPQELFCAKIIEACCTQDYQLNRRPKEVLNVRNAPAKPLCKGPRASFFPLQCLPRRSNALCHKVHFLQSQFLVIPHRPPSQNKKRPDKSRVRPEGHTLPVYLYLTMCAETGAKRPQSAETTR